MPSEFALLHYGKDVVMRPCYILDLITNHLISYMAFDSDMQKLSIELHLKVPVLLSRSILLHAYMKVDKMTVPNSLPLEAREMVLSLDVLFLRERLLSGQFWKISLVWFLH